MKLNDALRQLPNEKQLEVLLTDISNLGKTAGIEIKSFKREDERVHDFYAEVPISVAFEGRFHDIARFFDLVSRAAANREHGRDPDERGEPDRHRIRA